MFKKKRVDPGLDDVFWVFSSKDYRLFTGRSMSWFRSLKQRGKLVTIFVPVFAKWDLVRYRRVFVQKKDILDLVRNDIIDGVSGR